MAWPTSFDRGPHVLVCHEAACGVRIAGDATATRDIDLLFDTRQHPPFWTTLRMAGHVAHVQRCAQGRQDIPGAFDQPRRRTAEQRWFRGG